MRKFKTSIIIIIVLLLVFLTCAPPEGKGSSKKSSSGGGSKDVGSGENSDPEPIDYNEMVSITGGAYTQTDGTESFEHTISDFSIGKYEVTYDLWYTVYQWAINNGYTFANTGKEGSNGSIGNPPTTAKYEPVIGINWRDAIVWCNAYSEMTGLIPYYTYNDSIIKDSTDSNATACDNATCSWNANGYSLPTEGEWQFAASNKGETPYNHASGDSAPYNTSTTIGDFAWYMLNNDLKTHDTGTKISNQLGIYDMSGNVWEWCWDRNGNYPTGNLINYRGVSSGSDRILRGGSWINSPIDLQVGLRYFINPSYGYNYFGFRVATRSQQGPIIGN